MQLDELTPVLPEREWDELITASMRRGRTLRRRRRALAMSPVAAVLAIIVAIPLSGVFDSNRGGLARLHTTNVGPAQSPSPEPTPSLTATPAPAPSGVRPPNGVYVIPGGVGGRAAHPVGPPPSVAVPVPAAPPAGKVVRAVTLAYDDARGDGTPQAGPNAPATPSAAETSDPALDITHMSVTADRRSIRIAMDLLADYRTDGYYLAFLTDSRTGCQLTVLLGGAYHDSLWWTCGSSSGGSYIAGTPDTSRQLVATLSLSDLPGGAKPGDALTSIDGETKLVHPADGQWPYDEAPTSKVLRLP
jgi:hypothetical protein